MKTEAIRSSETSRIVYMAQLSHNIGTSFLLQFRPKMSHTFHNFPPCATCPTNYIIHIKLRTNDVRQWIYEWTTYSLETQPAMQHYEFKRGVSMLRKEKQFDLNDVTLIDSERVEIDTEGEGSMGNRTRCEGFARVCHRVLDVVLFCVSNRKVWDIGSSSHRCLDSSEVLRS
jgi:hypothetical protein